MLFSIGSEPLPESLFTVELDGNLISQIVAKPGGHFEFESNDKKDVFGRFLSIRSQPGVDLSLVKNFEVESLLAIY